MNEGDHRRPEGRGFLTRWSRRKREEEQESLAAAAPQPDIEPEAVSLKAQIEEPAFDVSILPEIESLTAESDISAFLQRGVPEALKNAALRRIWSSDPAIRDFIGPVDYQWDFNDPAGVPGFGPLGSDVDIEALLRQVIGGSERAPEPDLADPALQPLAGAQADAAAEEEAHDVTIGTQPNAESPTTQHDLASVQTHNANEAIALQKAIPLEEPPAKMRRHGSALPT
jgi:hypothetical protein